MVTSHMLHMIATQIVFICAFSFPCANFLHQVI